MRPIAISETNLQLLFDQGRSFEEYFRYLEEQNYIDAQAGLLEPEEIETLEEAEEEAVEEAEEEKEALEVPEAEEAPESPEQPQQQPQQPVQEKPTPAPILPGSEGDDPLFDD